MGAGRWTTSCTWYWCGRVSSMSVWLTDSLNVLALSLYTGIPIYIYRWRSLYANGQWNAQHTFRCFISYVRDDVACGVEKWSLISNVNRYIYMHEYSDDALSFIVLVYHQRSRVVHTLLPSSWLFSVFWFAVVVVVVALVLLHGRGRVNKISVVSM